MAEQAIDEASLAAKLTEAVLARTDRTVASDLATAVFARKEFPPSTDLRREMLLLYRYFRRMTAEPESKAKSPDRAG